MQKAPVTISALSNLPQVLAYGPGQWSNVHCYNPDPTNVAYLQFYEDTDAGPITVGTNQPWAQYAIPPKGSLPYDLGTVPFTNRLTVAAVSVVGSATAPITPLLFTAQIETFD